MCGAAVAKGLGIAEHTAANGYIKRAERPNNIAGLLLGGGVAASVMSGQTSNNTQEKSTNLPPPLPAGNTRPELGTPLDDLQIKDAAWKKRKAERDKILADMDATIAGQEARAKRATRGNP